MRRVSIGIGFSYACVFVYTQQRRHIVYGTNTHARTIELSILIRFVRISASVRCSPFFNMFKMEIMTKSMKYTDVIKRNSSLGLQYTKIVPSNLFEPHKSYI